MPKFLGKGGIGCILYPAYIDPSEKELLHFNPRDYVTKIGINTANEFERQEKIIRRLKENGIKPGIIGWFASEKLCKKKYIFLDYFAKFLSQYNTSDQKKSFKDEIQNQCIRVWEALSELDDQEEICLLQIKKYDSDLKSYNILNIEEFDNLFLQALIKLKTMHNNGIYHLDIKELNLAIKIIDKAPILYFTDWDLSFIEKDLLMKSKITTDFDFMYSNLLKGYGHGGAFQFYYTPSFGAFELTRAQISYLDSHLFKEAASTQEYNSLEYRKKICRRVDLMMLYLSFLSKRDSFTKDHTSFPVDRIKDFVLKFEKEVDLTQIYKIDFFDWRS